MPFSFKNCRCHDLVSDTFILYEYVMCLFSIFLHQLESFIILYGNVINEGTCTVRFSAVGSKNKIFKNT